jgi:hypothetical protein
MPKGYLTESGYHPEFAELYGALEHPLRTYPPRTERNVREADFTLIFVFGGEGPGTKLTIRKCQEWDKPFIVVIYGTSSYETPGRVAYSLKLNDVKTLNVAGSREGGGGEVGRWVEGYMAELLSLTNPPGRVAELEARK